MRMIDGCPALICSICAGKSCPIRALTFGKDWISMACNGVISNRIDEPSHQFTRDEADLRSGFSFAGVAQW